MTSPLLLPLPGRCPAVATGTYPPFLPVLSTPPDPRPDDPPVFTVAPPARSRSPLEPEAVSAAQTFPCPRGTWRVPDDLGLLTLTPWVAPCVLGQLQACPVCSLCGLRLDRPPENEDGDRHPPPRPGLQTQADAARAAHLVQGEPVPRGLPGRHARWPPLPRPLALLFPQRHRQTWGLGHKPRGSASPGLLLETRGSMPRVGHPAGSARELPTEGPWGLCVLVTRTPRLASLVEGALGARVCPSSLPPCRAPHASPPWEAVSRLSAHHDSRGRR